MYRGFVKLLKETKNSEDSQLNDRQLNQNEPLPPTIVAGSAHSVQNHEHLQDERRSSL